MWCFAMTRALIDVGFYGKLPCRGDFLQRRVPAEFVEPWDAWLQESLHLSKEVLQETWLGTYLSGPVWRFALAPGVCGDGAHAGLFAPSVDRVGRYFPLTVVAKLEPQDCLLDFACTGADWLEAAEALVLEAIAADALDFDTFDEQIALLRERISLGTSRSLQSAVNEFAWREMARTMSPLSVWWQRGTDGSASQWSLTQGLPHSHAFVAMLSGEPAAAPWPQTKELA
jgi:type VI secretion system protein ImpM